ncbi:MAG: putative short-chain dehydrogenase/reductase [Ignavibacteria bacterium]|nr:putative short-chain dehydrogenase/reductase [Ignavibacteria bacterium]
MKLSLEDRTAIVCGASQGIGAAIAIKLAEMDASVILLARSEEKLKKILESLKCSKKQEHSYIVADLSDPESARSKVESILATRKSIEILINNTGGPAPGEILKAAPEAFLQAFGQQLIASHVLTQLLVDGMKRSGFGRIINIISVGLRQPIDDLGVSNTIRGAVGSWAKTLSRELAAFGITVNNILPGYTKTERLDSLLEKRAENEGISKIEAENKISSLIPANRVGRPEEIAYAACFLASAEASYINGVNLPVDGGFLRCL